MEPGQKLALARKYAEPALTQDELAKKLSINQSSVGRWEANNEVPAKHLPALQKLLNVHLEWFHDGSDLPPNEVRLDMPYVAPAPAKSSQMTIREKIAAYPKEDVSAEQDDNLVWLPLLRGWAPGGIECIFVEFAAIEYRDFPAFFTAGKSDNHVLCVAAGRSLAPRMEQGSRALIRLDTGVSAGRLVLATSPEGKNYIKALMNAGPRELELRRLSGDEEPIPFADGWTIKGGVTAIWHDYEHGAPNIEWDGGKYLRA